ncbi:MAG: hypothetical protein ACW98K_16365 [Candidatus Kariarchaeaceae archaeon]|jgi:hypothetical protein
MVGKDDLRDEVKECLRMLDRAKTELYWEIEYNDRKKMGNMIATDLFGWCCPLVAKIPFLCNRIISLKVRESSVFETNEVKRVEKAILQGAGEINKLFQRLLIQPGETRDFVVLLYGRICYISQKFDWIIKEVYTEKVLKIS